MSILFGLPVVGKIIEGAFAFFSTTIGQLVLVVALIFGGFLYGRHAGAEAEIAVCKRQKQESVDAAREIDTRAAAEAKTRMEKTIRESQASLAQMKEQVDEYGKQAEKCSATDADVNFLNGLGGVPGRSVPGRQSPAPSRR